jgi:hypothetical protein
MPEVFNGSWNGLFSNLGGQGNAFNNLISPSNRYYAFLSKVDGDKYTDVYDVFFELMPKEWADNAFFAGQIDIRAQAPTPPASCYHIPRVSGTEMARILGLQKAEDMMEGSWYEIMIEKSISDDDIAVGYLYDPALDFDPNAPRPPQ